MKKVLIKKIFFSAIFVVFFSFSLVSCRGSNGNIFEPKITNMIVEDFNMGVQRLIITTDDEDAYPATRKITVEYLSDKANPNNTTTFSIISNKNRGESTDAIYLPMDSRGFTSNATIIVQDPRHKSQKSINFDVNCFDYTALPAMDESIQTYSDYQEKFTNEMSIIGINNNWDKILNSQNKIIGIEYNDPVNFLDKQEIIDLGAVLVSSEGIAEIYRVSVGSYVIILDKCCDIAQIKNDLLVCLNYVQNTDHTIRIFATPSNQGDVSFDNSSWTNYTTRRIVDGANVFLYARAELGYAFESWYENGVQISYDNPLNITMTEDRVIEARFEELPNTPPAIYKGNGPDNNEIINFNYANFSWYGSDYIGSRYISKYCIKKDGGEWRDHDPITGTFYTWENIDEGTHTFSVKAIDEEEAESSVLTWTFVYEIPIGGAEWVFTAGEGIMSSPAIASDGTIYVGADDKKLYALNPDGTKKWEFLSVDRIDNSPAIACDGTIYFASSYNNILYAINPDDGTKKWEYVTDEIIYTSPTIGNGGIIYIGSANKLYTINPDGTKQWEFLAGNNIYSNPSIASDGTVYFGCSDNKLYAINPDGTKKWEFLANALISTTPSIGADGTIYFGATDFKLYAINPDGTKKWEYLFAEDSISSDPVIGNNGMIYFGSIDNKLYAVNSDGTKEWEFVAGGDIYSTAAIGDDGTIYFGCTYAEFFAINPDGTKKWSFWSGNSIYSSPAIGNNGTLYFGSLGKRFYAIRTECTGLLNSPWPKYQQNQFNTGCLLEEGE